MAVYHVSYDLSYADDEYEGLGDELKKFEHRHILQSTWLIATDETAKELYRRLKPHFVDGNGRILITEVTANRGVLLKPSGVEFLNAHV
jgi:hypothetical protein